MTDTLHIIGPKNSGKTTLIKYLIRALSDRGYRIGAYKHSAHDHPLDKPGSDSDSFRQAGAHPVVFESGKGLAVFFNRLQEEQKQRLLAAVYENCDLILIESFGSARGAKIIIRNDDRELENTSDIVAVVNPQGEHAKYPAFRPQSKELVEFIVNHFLEKNK